MSAVQYQSQARNDLLEIWRYVARQSQSEEVADKLIDAIDDRSLIYAQNPELGTPRTDLGERVRFFVVSNHVIFYRPGSEGIEVLRVMHGRRDIEASFRAPG